MNNDNQHVIPTEAREERAGEAEESVTKRKTMQNKTLVQYRSRFLGSARNDGVVVTLRSE
jgi:hypothetical protein